MEEGSPYRAAPAPTNPKITFGDTRTARVLRVVALLLLAFSVASLASWLFIADAASWFGWVGRIKVFVVVPALLAGVLLYRATWGSLEHRLDTRELVVTWHRFGLRKQQRLAIAELTGVTIDAASRDPKDPTVELRLNLTNARHVVLLRGDSVEDLEPWRERVGRFVLENGLLATGDSPRRVRIAEENTPAVDGEDAEGESRARRSRSS